MGKKEKKKSKRRGKVSLWRRPSGGGTGRARRRAVPFRLSAVQGPDTPGGSRAKQRRYAMPSPRRRPSATRARSGRGKARAVAGRSPAAPLRPGPPGPACRVKAGWDAPRRTSPYTWRQVVVPGSCSCRKRVNVGALFGRDPLPQVLLARTCSYRRKPPVHWHCLSAC